MRICRVKATGKIIEAQSGGTEQRDLDMLIQNAVAGGHLAGDVEAKYVTDAEYRDILHSQLTPSLLKLEKLNQLKVCTRAYITSDSPNEKRMPEWRQVRWLRYADMYEKKAGGGVLTARETSEYNAMIAAGETELSVYNDILAAVNWIQGCIVANDVMEAQIEACATLEQLDAINITTCPYPAWEGWGAGKAYIKPS